MFKKILIPFIITSFCINSYPVLAKSWYFRAKDKQGQSLIGVFDNNRGESCLNIKGKVFKGIMPLDEADSYITGKSQSHFISFIGVEPNRLKPVKKNLYFKTYVGPGYLELTKWMKGSEIDSLNSCPDIYYFNGALENGKRALGIVIKDRGRLCLKSGDELIIGKANRKQLQSFSENIIENEVIKGNKILKKGMIISKNTKTIFSKTQEFKISNSFGQIYTEKLEDDPPKSMSIEQADFLNQCLYY